MKHSNDSRKTTRSVALGGLLAALAILFLVIGAISPTADLSLLALSSLPIAIAVIELGYRHALLVYGVVSLISLAWPGIAFSYMFIFFFGVFPILKAVCEFRLNRPTAALVKQLVANFLIILAAWLFAGELILAQSTTWGWWYIPALVVLLQVIVLIYDYALALLISFYLDRLARHLKR
jgi:hypothetical protein